MPSTEKGRKRVREAASIWDDSGSKILRLIGDEESFVYLMTHQCYRKCVLRKSLDIPLSKDSVKQNDENSRRRNSDQLRVHPEVQLR